MRSFNRSLVNLLWLGDGRPACVDPFPGQNPLHCYWTAFGETYRGVFTQAALNRYLRLPKDNQTFHFVLHDRVFVAGNLRRDGALQLGNQVCARRYFYGMPLNRHTSVISLEKLRLMRPVLVGPHRMYAFTSLTPEQTKRVLRYIVRYVPTLIRGNHAKFSTPASNGAGAAVPPAAEVEGF